MHWKSEDEFQNEIGKKLERFGYDVSKNVYKGVPESGSGFEIDFLAKDRGSYFFIELKTRNVNPSDIIPLANLMREGHKNNYEFILVTNDEPKEEIRNLAERKGVKIMHTDDFLAYMKFKIRN